MDIIKEKTKLANRFYNSLTSELAKKVSAIVTSNKKLEDTSTNIYKTCGIALYPAFKNSCSNATSCKSLCIGFTGIGQISSGSKHASLSNIDKAMLKRLWLLRNDSKYFYSRAKNEIEKLSDFGEHKILFREITSECIDYRFFENIPYVTTYGYFKDSTKIDQTFKTVNMPRIPLYSWNEKSRVGLLQYCKNYVVPIAVVVPKKVFKTLLNNPINNSSQVDFNICGDIVFHNGDRSDLNSYWNSRIDKLNIHLLSEKTARYGNVIDRPVFLDSYKKLFQYLSFEVSGLNKKVMQKIGA